MAAVGIYNADGEPIGIEYHYEPDPADWYDDDRDPGPEPSDIGPFEGCCKRGDWSGAKHQPQDAVVFVPHLPKAQGWNAWRGVPRTIFVEETTPAYRWTCEYCDREGTSEELNDG